MKKSIVNHIVLILLLSLVCFAGMAGCAERGEDRPGQAGESTAPIDQSPPGESATVRFAGFSAGDSDTQTLTDMLDMFSDAYPHITVIDESPGYGDYFTELNARINSGDAPDVFEVKHDGVRELTKRNAILALDEMVDRHGADKNVYPQGLVRLCTVSGQLMALPFSYNAVMLIYNMDLFDASGAEYPTSEWTWDDVLMASQKIAKPEEDIWGCCYGIDQTMDFYTKVVQNGGRFYTGEGEFTINASKNVEALQWLQDLAWVYHVMPTEEERAGRSESDMFCDGKLGMFLGSTEVFGDLGERCGGLCWGVETEPGNTRNTAQVTCNVLCVNQSAGAPDAAYALARFLSSDPGAIQLRTDAGWALPPVSDPGVMGSIRGMPPENKTALSASADYAISPLVIDNYELFAKGIMTPHLEAVRDNTMIPKEALDAAQSQAEAQIGLACEQ